MTDIKRAQITRLVDLLEQTLTDCLNEKVISSQNEAILRESAHCLEEGYCEWLRMPMALVLAVRALSHILGELTVHKELNLGPWSGRGSLGMRLLERAEKYAQLSAKNALHFTLAAESETLDCYEIWRMPRRVQ